MKIEEAPQGAMTPAELREKYPKFFGTMAYPYMNGTLLPKNLGYFSRSSAGVMAPWGASSNEGASTSKTLFSWLDLPAWRASVPFSLWVSTAPVCLSRPVPISSPVLAAALLFLPENFSAASVLTSCVGAATASSAASASSLYPSK
jgi:hypothetical protein